MPTLPALDPVEVLGITRAALPRHIAIIMDGNGRWARQRDLPRIEGHRRGSAAVREIVRQCARLGIECLTLYSFSAENWRRPKEEVDALMTLCAQYLIGERQEIMDNDVRLRQIGRRDGLPESVLRELEETERISQDNRGLTLCLALNYGSRIEIIHAIRTLAERVQVGQLQPDAIDEEVFSAALDTAGLPDPDLVIRTADERRLSNFLLWQISYAELYVTPVLWPDFGVNELHEALVSYARRERRYGAVEPPQSPLRPPPAPG
ncbi:MAG: isoprenyl transferase [Planctomycetes bacterium]|nr:isoprenyl transferase [Planctomycetota bacterium]